MRSALASAAGPVSDKHPAPIRKFDPTARLRGWGHLAGEVDKIRDRVRARAPAGPPELAARNANYVGGDIGTGAASGLQILLRPKLSLSPYGTPHPAVFICSSATAR